MSRSVNDPRVAEALAAFDEVCASQHRDEDIVNIFMRNVTGWTWEGWPDSAVRGVLFGYLANAPSEDFDALIASAREALAWNRWWNARGYYESLGEAVH